MKNWTSKWGQRLATFTIAVVFLFMIYPSTAKAVEYTPDLVPTLNALSEGVTASSFRPADKPWMAFDDNYWSTSWATATGGTHWLAYEFAIPRTITRYTFYTTHGQFDADYGPITKVALEGFTEGAWREIKATNLNEILPFYDISFDNTIAYKKYRISATGTDDKPFLIFDVSLHETKSIPAKPVNGKADFTDGKINLSWEGVSQATQYKIRRSVNNGEYQNLVTVTTPNYVDLTVSYGNTYSYKVSAVNQLGTGVESDVIVPDVYYSLIPVMSSNNSSGIVITPSTENVPWHPAWHAFDNNPDTAWEATSYLGSLAVKLPEPKVVTKFSFSATENDYSQVPPTRFDFEAYNGSAWVKLGEYTKSDWEYDWGYQYVEYEINNATAYDQYRINVLSSYSYGTLAIGHFQLYVEKPTQVLNLFAIPGDAKVDLEWTAINSATGYKVKRATDPNGSFDLLTTVTSTNYTDTNVVNGMTYYYKVSAVNEAGEGPDSNVVSATPWKVITATFKTTYTHDIDLDTASKLQKVKFNLNSINGSTLPTAISVERLIEDNWESIYNGTVSFGNNELTFDNSQSSEKYRLTLQFDQASPVSLTGLVLYGSD